MTTNKSEEKIHPQAILHINSIYRTVSGEVGCVFPQGAFTTIIRLQGCNLRCKYCDTFYAQDANSSIRSFVVNVNRLESEVLPMCVDPNVLITGGEPLIQYTNVTYLVRMLARHGKNVQIETNGSIRIPALVGMPNVGWVVDVKCPCSGMSDMMPSPETMRNNLQAVISHNPVVVKFVCKGDEDIYFAASYISVLKSIPVLRFAFSPVIDSNSPILPSKNATQFFHTAQGVCEKHNVLDRTIISLQVHKYLSVS